MVLINRDLLQSVFIPLLILAVVCGSILVALNYSSRDKIYRNQQRHTLKFLHQVFPLRYNNDLFEDRIEITAPELIDGENKLMVYRARLDDTPVGLVLTPVRANGYNGKIKFAIGLSIDGAITGIHILRHRETDGMGGQIGDPQHPWLQAFLDQSLARRPASEWILQSDGGTIDQLSGATITSRAMVNALRKTLEFYQINKDALYLN